MIALAVAALVLLTINTPTNQVDEYKVHIGTASSNYTQVVTFPATNKFALTNVPLGRVYMAMSAVNAYGESDLSSEIQVLVMVGDVQLGETVSGPWTNYLPISVAIQIDRPSQAVRTKLRVQ